MRDRRAQFGIGNVFAGSQRAALVDRRRDIAANAEQGRGRIEDIFKGVRHRARQPRERQARQARLAGLVLGMQCGGDAPLGRDQIGPPLEQRRRQPGRRRRWHGRQVNSRGELGRGIAPDQ